MAGDGDIDINDLQFVYGRFASTCGNPWPAQPPVNPKAPKAKEYPRPPTTGGARLRRGIMAQSSDRRASRWRGWIVALGGLVLAAAAVLLLQLAPTGTHRSVHATDLECPVPVDVSLVMDHSGSMGTPASKLANAKTAAKGFIDALAGGPSDNDLTPHEVALTSFTNGNASTDVALTTNAATLRTTINGFGAAGFTQIGRALALGQLQLEPPVEPDLPTDANDYMVLLSDGSANEPQDIDSSRHGKRPLPGRERQRLHRHRG